MKPGEVPAASSRTQALRVSRFSIRHPEDVKAVVTTGCRNNEVSQGLLSLKQQKMGAKISQKAVEALLHFKTCEKWASDSASSKVCICPNRKFQWSQAAAASLLRYMTNLNQLLKSKFRGFPGGSVVKNLPADAGDAGSILG